MKHYAFLVIAVVGVLLLVKSAPVSGQSPSNIKAPAFRPDPSWPAIPNNWVFGEVSSVAVDSQDHVWIIHRPNTIPADQKSKAAPPVLEFDSSGKFMASWGGPAAGYDWPEREHGIYVDPSNFVWIGGNNGYGTPLPPGDSDDMLLKFTAGGKFVLQIGHRNSSGGNADTKNLHQAADAFLNPAANEILVADGYANQRVIVFDAATGAFKRLWGAFGNKPEKAASPAPGSQSADGPSQFGLVHSIKVSKDGLVYVADRANHRIQVFTTDGKYLTQKFIGTTGQTAAGLAFSPDAGQQFLYVADLADSQIVVLNRKTLDVVTTIGRPGSAPGEFGTLHHMAADSKGNLYTAEIGRGRRAQKLALVK
jgi:DNA-binding beta-propeller fold protein YncE